jgi:hypothetical protein
VRGRAVDPERLRHLFGQVQLLRTVNLYGFMSIQRFYLSAATGLSRQRVSIWIAEGQLQIAYRETLLAQYRCAYDRRQRRRREVSPPTLSQTVCASPQLELIELGDAQWGQVQQRSFSQRTSLQTSIGEQLRRAGGETSVLIFFVLTGIGVVRGNFFPPMSCVP